MKHDVVKFSCCHIGDYEGSLQFWSKEGKRLRSVKKANNKTYLSIDWHPTKDIILTGSDKIRIFEQAMKLGLSEGGT